MIDEGKKYFNKNNEEKIKIIEKFFGHEKYQKMANDYFKEDIEKLIKESISQLERNQKITPYIKDFFENQKKIDKNFYLNSLFKGDISSLNFMILGDKNVDKRKFIDAILGINAKHKKKNLISHKNKEKTGIKFTELSTNSNYFENLCKKFDGLIHKEGKFIFGYIYLGNASSLKEEKNLLSLREYHYDKIPIKKINYKNGEEKLSKKEFIKFLEELDEDKLKSIYKYYYSLNYFENFKNIIISINSFINIFSSLIDLDIENKDAAKKLIIEKLKLNLNVLFLRPNLNYENINKKIGYFYRRLLDRLNEDFKDSNIDYTIEEEKKWYDIFNLFIEKHPRDFIPIFLYEKITKLVEEAFLNEMEEIIVNTDYNFDIKYPII